MRLFLCPAVSGRSPALTSFMLFFAVFLGSKYGSDFGRNPEHDCKEEPPPGHDMLMRMLLLPPSPFPDRPQPLGQNPLEGSVRPL